MILYQRQPAKGIQCVDRGRDVAVNATPDRN